MIGYLPPLLPTQRTLPELFDILEVDSSWDPLSGARRSFAGVPWLVYRDDPYWTPRLLADRRRAVDLARRARGPEELGLFYAESRSPTATNPGTGSLAVWTLPAVEGQRAAAFGMFEAVNSSALIQALFDRGETWLFEHTGSPSPGSPFAGPVKVIRGPLSLQPFTLPGLLVDGFGERPGGLLPYNPPYYPDMLDEAGYAAGSPAGSEWHSYTVELDEARDMVASREAEPGLGALGGGIPSGIPSGVPTGLLPGLAECVREYSAQGRVTTEDLSRQGRWLATALLRQAFGFRRGGAGCLAVPDPGLGLRLAKGSLLPFGWALLRAALARSRQLQVYPAAAAGTAEEDIRAVYAAAFAEAKRRGFRSAVVAPVPAGDDVSAGVLRGAGARVSHRYALFEKSF